MKDSLFLMGENIYSMGEAVNEYIEQASEYLQRRSVYKKNPSEDDVAGVGDLGALYIASALKDATDEKKPKKNFLSDIFTKLFGGTAVGAMASKIFPALLQALPLAAIAGGIIWGIMDGLKAMGEAENWGVSKLQAFIGGFIAGEGGGGIKNAFKNAGKWALMGAGLGLMVGGPAGAVAGGLIGGAIGGIVGYIGAEKTANFIKDIMEDVGFQALAGAGIGAITGFMIGGPVGALAGAFIGLAIGGIKTVLEADDPEAMVKELFKSTLFVTAGGAILGGAIGFAIGGPVGLVIGALLGGAIAGITSAIAGAEDPKEMAKKIFSSTAFIASAGAVVGGGIGFFVGGPVGMAIGAILGGAIAGITAYVKSSGDPKAMMEKIKTKIKDSPAMQALAGMAIGAGAGLLFGPIGVVIGAILGTALGAIGGMLMTDEAKAKREAKKEERRLRKEQERLEKEQRKQARRAIWDARIGNVQESITDFVTTLWDKIVTVYSDVKTNVAEGLINFAELVKTTWNKVEAWLVSKTDDIKNVAMVVGNFFSDTFTSLKDWISTKVQGLITDFKESKVVNFFEETYEKVKTWIDDKIITPMVNFFGRIGNFFSFIADIWKQDTNVANKLVDTVTYATGLAVTKRSATRVQEVERARNARLGLGDLPTGEYKTLTEEDIEAIADQYGGLLPGGVGDTMVITNNYSTAQDLKDINE
jgi:hypothetical protein